MFGSKDGKPHTISNLSKDEEQVSGVSKVRSRSEAPGEQDADDAEIQSVPIAPKEATSEWAEMYANYYGSKNEFNAISNVLSGKQIFPGKYDDVQIDSNVIKQLKEEAKKRKGSFIYQLEGQTSFYIFINEDKILVCDKKLGTGAEGAVWRAQDIEDKDLWYAVKIPHEFQDGYTLHRDIENHYFEDLERFLRRVELLGKNEQYFFIEDMRSKEKRRPKKPTLPLQLGEASTLEDYIIEKILSKRNSKLTLADIYEFLRILLAILDRLKLIHDAKHVHHDLKPANILINPQTGNVKIIDVEKSPKINGESVIGTPTFSDIFLYGDFDLDTEEEAPPRARFDTPNDVFSFGVIAAGMLRYFDFRKTEEGLYLTRDIFLHPKFDTKKYETTSSNIAKEVTDYISTHLLTKDPKGRDSIDTIKANLTAFADNCYEQLLKDRTQFHKIGMVNFSELVMKSKSGKYRLNSEMIPALKSLDGFYIYLSPELEKDAKQAKMAIDAALELCKKYHLPLRGIIGDKDLPPQPPSQQLEESEEKRIDDRPQASDHGNERGEKNNSEAAKKVGAQLPLHLNLPLDRFRERIEQIENKPVVFKGVENGTTSALLTFFYVSSEVQDHVELAIRAHNMGVLDTSKSSRPSYFQNSAKKQLQSRLVTQEDFDKTIQNLKAKRDYFQGKIDGLKTEIEKLEIQIATLEAKGKRPNKLKDKLKELKTQQGIYNRELSLTKSLIDKVTVQYGKGKLTYQTLINSLQGYRTEFQHTTFYKNFFRTILGLNHNTKSANEIKKLESDLKKSERAQNRK